MTREEAALILHSDTTMFALDEATARDYKTRIELVEEACRMGAEALRNGTKVIEKLKNINWVFFDAEKRIRESIELLEGAGNDKG